MQRISYVMRVNRAKVYILILGSILLPLSYSQITLAADTGGYPNADAGNCSSVFGIYAWCVDHNNNGRFDGLEWASVRGYAYRNCTDFVSWKLLVTNGFSLPGGKGNARYWGEWARKANYRVDSLPASGAVAWWDANRDGRSAFGHVAWVESINPDGSVNIQQYNGDGNGNYSRERISRTSPSGYIHLDDLEEIPRAVLAPRAITRVGSNLYLSEGINSPWQLISSSASQGQWWSSGWRIANLDANGLWVKDGAGPWQRWSNSDAEEVQVSESRVVTRVGSNLYSIVNGSIKLISSSASAGSWKIAGDRVANLDANGLWIRDGEGVWRRLSNPDVEEYQISSSRIVTRVGSNLYIPSDSGVQHISNTATQGSWKAVGDRIVNRDTNGLWVKDGDSGWQRWSAGDPEEFQVSNSQVITRVGADLYSLDGSSIRHISNTASPGRWSVDGDYVVNLDANGFWLWQKNGIWQRWSNPDPEEFQLSQTLQ